MAGKNSLVAEPVVDREIVLTRVFDAPRELVFKAWTDPKHMAQWWGPKAFTNPVCQMDLRPGGAWRIVVRSPDGIDYPLKGVFREIVEPERLVMTFDCSEHPDEWHDLVNPNRDKAKGRPALDLLCTVTFEDQAGKTKLTVQTLMESVAIRDAMVKMGMKEGWGQSLDRLEAVLASAEKR
jgi:uncharacterized protein YndB with AHSA1/START domain